MNAATWPSFRQFWNIVKLFLEDSLELFNPPYKLDQETWSCRTNLNDFLVKIWTILDHLWPFWTIEDHLGTYWKFWNHYIPFRNISKIMGPYLTILDYVGSMWIVWDHFGPFGTIWDHLGQCWTIGIAICLSHYHLEPFTVIGSHLEPFGAIWSQLTVPDGTQGSC